LAGDNVEKTHEKSGGFFFCFLITRSFRNFSASSPEALSRADAVRGGAIASGGAESFDDEVVVRSGAWEQRRLRKIDL
jgi:hypothetical protein